MQTDWQSLNTHTNTHTHTHTHTSTLPVSFVQDHDLSAHTPFASALCTCIHTHTTKQHFMYVAHVKAAQYRVAYNALAPCVCAHVVW